MRESHAQAFDPGVANTPRLPGVPIWAVGNRPFSNFGACTTALDDGSSLIYQVTPGHPLGVEPDDRILGMRAGPGASCIGKLLEAELAFSADSGWDPLPSWAAAPPLGQSSNG